MTLAKLPEERTKKVLLALEPKMYEAILKIKQEHFYPSERETIRALVRIGMENYQLKTPL